MSQFKIYGHARFLSGKTETLSRTIHRAAVEALGLPEAKRFHRFIALEEDYFLAPEDRSDRYLIIECTLFEGRSLESKKDFYQRLLARFGEEHGISPQDVEMTFLETPRHNWLIRGLAGDELELNYKVEG